MATPITIIEKSTKRCELIARSASVMRIKLTNVSKIIKIKKAFSKRRVRANTIYALLIASIFFTFLNAILTCRHLRSKDLLNLNATFHEKSWILQNSREFNPLLFSSFVLLALTCSLALVTLVKKERSNARLLSKLRTTNRQLENQVSARTNELAEAVRAKDHFLGVATHDLKAPLSGILGLVELIKIENKNMAESEAEYLGHIKYSCNKMQRLIHDILEINRIDQGKAIMKKEKVNLSHLKNELRRNFATGAAKKSIHLIIDDTDGTIETDADSLTRILENLLSNAIKFSPSMKKVWLNVILVADQARFEVVDEGPGIPVEEQHKLFNKFQRLSNRPTNSEISTGLGLSIVRELTTQLGGEITFKSEVGKGTTFIVALPNAQAERKHFRNPDTQTSLQSRSVEAHLNK